MNPFAGDFDTANLRFMATERRSFGYFDQRGFYEIIRPGLLAKAEHIDTDWEAIFAPVAT